MGPPSGNLASTSGNRNDFALFLHHGGRFVTIENTKEYFGGDDSFKYELDIDRFGYFDLEEEVKNLGYSEWASLYYKIPGTFEFKIIHNDKEVMEMIAVLQTLNHYVHIYVEGGKKNEASTGKKGICAENEDDEVDNEVDNEDEHENIGKNVVCSESEKEDANDKSDSEEDINDFIDNYNIGVEDELEQPEREEPTRSSEDEVEDDDYTPDEESSSSDGLSADDLGTDDEEYLNARSERAALRKNAPPENDQHIVYTH
ncbi:bacteriophage SPP1 adsorption protein YueB [Striga asiatica]|uniref:Bacteriophage SPP1 adsorption protein YueB n=1 Tax=Striga asiatica TaxID=4170 RepID=A0A5A7NYF7_STRAF|nr:bacteriophage SPP1 adsorption protein YueB [Striga asiatica]